MTLIIKKVKVEREEVIGIKCNNCKVVFSYEDDIIEAQEVIHIERTGGYGSIIGDGAEYSLTLCQSCFVNILDDCIIIK